MEKQNLNILPTGGVLPIIHCSQGDIGREFQIILYSEGIPYLLDGTEDLTIDGRKDDGNIFSYILDPVVGSTITISTEEQMTACAGNVVCEIRITKGTTIIGTCNFIIQVEEGPSNNGSLSESALQALDAIRAELQQAVEDAESYNAQSKSWAVGPSGTGSGTDTNNSKYYSEQSSNSATNSQNSANASSSSATDSKNWAVGPSGSGSGTDTNNSKYYSQQSANSASDSSGYATNSQNSANASASSATDSKNWAVGPSGSGSATDSNNAKYYSDQSSNSATNASNSANSASSSANDSKNWAVGPSGSGSGTDSNNSKYYSEQSANSATNASNSASDANTAKLGAEAAQQKIENMTASATQLPEGSTPTVNKSEVGGVVNLSFGIPKGDTGDTGATGADGVSPEVTIGTISGGHSVTITDADHPTGQTFNVMDGEDGLGVPSGGTTGQVLAKASNADNDTEWVNSSGGGYTKPNTYQSVNFFVSAGLATVNPPTGSGRVVATGNKCWNRANTLELNEYAFNFKLSPNSSDTDVEKIQIGFSISNYTASFHSGEVNVYWWDSNESQFVALDYAIKGSGPTPSDNPCYIIATLPEMQNIDSTNILWVSGKAYVRS